MIVEIRRLKFMEWVYKLLFSFDLLDGIKEIFITFKNRNENIFVKILYTVSVLGGILFTARLWS